MALIDIRPIRLCDVDACRKIVLGNWNVHFANRFTREISNCFSDMDEPPIYYVAEVDGDLAGFAGMTPTWLKEGVWHFTWINVRKEYRGEGVGKKLVEYRLEEVRRCAGSIVHLMTQIPWWFEQFDFATIRDYGEWQLMEKQLKAVD